MSGRISIGRLNTQLALERVEEDLKKTEQRYLLVQILMLLAGLCTIGTITSILIAGFTKLSLIAILVQIVCWISMLNSRASIKNSMVSIEESKKKIQESHELMKKAEEEL